MGHDIYIRLRGKINTIFLILLKARFTPSTVSIVFGHLLSPLVFSYSLTQTCLSISLAIKTFYKSDTAVKRQDQPRVLALKRGWQELYIWLYSDLSII